MTTKPLARLLAPMLALLLLAACGGSGGSDSKSTTTAAPSGTTATGGSAGGDVISIKGFAFHPNVLRVKAGTKVTFTNDDTARHSAVDDKGTFDTKAISPGSSATVTLSKPGTVTYHCGIHPTMTAEIDVT